jgi:hypothetical protein
MQAKCTLIVLLVSAFVAISAAAAQPPAVAPQDASRTGNPIGQSTASSPALLVAAGEQEDIRPFFA